MNITVKGLVLILFLLLFVGCSLPPKVKRVVKPVKINKDFKYISCIRILNREGVRQELIGGFCKDALGVGGVK